MDDLSTTGSITIVWVGEGGCQLAVTGTDGRTVDVWLGRSEADRLADDLRPVIV